MFLGCSGVSEDTLARHLACLSGLVGDCFPPSLSLRGCLNLCPVWPCPSPPFRPPPFRQVIRKLTLSNYSLMATDQTPNRRGPGRPTAAETAQRRRELSQRQRAYVLWEASNHATREPKTLAEFCEVIGISRQSAWKWSKDPRIVEAIRFVTLQNAGDPMKVKDLLDMVYEVAMSKRDPKLAEVWLKATGVFSQFGRSGDLLEIPDDLETDTFENYSLEQLEELRDQALAANLEAVTIELAQRKLSESQSEQAG